MGNRSKVFLFLSLIVSLIGCREPFTPDFKTGVNDYLVVEGFIHVGQKAVTTITLSHITPLLSPGQVLENNALLFINDEDGTLYPLYEGSTGHYTSNSLNLDTTREYQLLISTDNGNHYRSDFIKPTTSPGIDSLHWLWKAEGIEIYVSSHDSENKTRYYKWNYQETWEIHSAYKSKYVYKDGLFELRGAHEFDLYECWQSASPDDIHFASTTQLEEDIIHYPLTLFGHYSDRTSVKYSIFVEQRALAKEEFDYLELIQKNSTVTGSLFDPMPSEIRGNIHSLTNPDERVIGFIGASTTQTKRFFVTAAEFGISPAAKCDPTEVSGQNNFDTFFASGLLIPIDLIESLPVPKYSAAPTYCMDCRHRGSPTMPDFWK